MHEEGYRWAKETGLMVHLTKFVMDKPVLKSALSPEDVGKIRSRIPGIFLSPRYIMNRAKAIRNWDDISVLLRGTWASLGRSKDFGRPK